jgi:hypothetical protein
MIDFVDGNDLPQRRRVAPPRSMPLPRFPWRAAVGIAGLTSRPAC